MRAFLPILVAALAGCGRSSIPEIRAEEIAPPVDDAGADAVDAPDDALDSGCHATLVVGAVTPMPASCWIDEKVDNQSAVLQYPCDGGAAVAMFEVPFSGTVDAQGEVDISATTTFSWSDGCTWNGVQRIHGTLSTKTLSYTYSEHPIAGKNCAPAYCTAQNSVGVQ